MRCWQWPRTRRRNRARGEPAMSPRLLGGLLAAVSTCSTAPASEGTQTPSISAADPSDPIALVLGPQSNSFCDLEPAAPGPDDSLTAVQVASASQIGCARLRNGRVRCWGANDRQQLPTCNAASAHAVPTDFVGVDDAVDISVGRFGACAVTSDGSLACSHSIRAQLGAQGVGPIEGVTEATQVSIGDRHACVLRADRSVLCFGHADAAEALGARFDVAGEESASPRAAGFVSVSDTRSLAAGADHTCALDGQGQVMCWGLNTHGQLGDPRAPAELEENRGTPRRVAGLPYIRVLRTRGDVSCGVSDAGEAFCWGKGFGVATQLGVPSASDIAIGEGFVCIVVQGEDVACFGASQSWLPTDRALDGFRGVEELAVGDAHLCGRTRDGIVLCQGDTSRGQLGNGAPTSEVDPTSPGKMKLVHKPTPVLLAGVEL